MDFRLGFQAADRVSAGELVGVLACPLGVAVQCGLVKDSPAVILHEDKGVMHAGKNRETSVTMCRVDAQSINLSRLRVYSLVAGSWAT